MNKKKKKKKRKRVIVIVKTPNFKIISLVAERKKKTYLLCKTTKHTVFLLLHRRYCNNIVFARILVKYKVSMLWWSDRVFEYSRTPQAYYEWRCLLYHLLLKCDIRCRPPTNPFKWHGVGGWDSGSRVWTWFGSSRLGWVEHRHVFLSAETSSDFL